MESRNTKIRCKKSLSLVHIPQEIIEEILPVLRVKSLLRFRCVSKSWRSLIDSEQFIHKHRKNSEGRRIFNKYCSIFNDPWWPIDDPSNDYLKKDSSVVGCINGVLCVATKDCCLFLWNPAIRISIKLPYIDLPEEYGCGFGWDEESDAYKVFVGMSVSVSYNDDGDVDDYYYVDNGGIVLGEVYSLKKNSWKTVGKVYSSKTNSWKTVECMSNSACKKIGVFACGKIHWISARGYYIESFDFKSEVFGRIELPIKPENGVERWLRERDGLLYVLYNNNDHSRRRGRDEEDLLDVWVMEEYGVKESWVKKSTIPIPSDVDTAKFVSNREKKITACDQQYFYAESLVSPVGTD